MADKIEKTYERPRKSLVTPAARIDEFSQFYLPRVVDLRTLELLEIQVDSGIKRQVF